MSDLGEALAHYGRGHRWSPKLLTIVAAARNWHTLTNLAASYEHAERVRQAVEEYDLALTVHEDVRLLAHGAVKSLELFDALTDTAEPEERRHDPAYRIGWESLG